MYTIRAFREEIVASDVNELMAELVGLSGSVSVIATRPVTGMKAVCYVDVNDGLVRKSYGDQRVLKAADFHLEGEAFS